jgi:phosphonate transport system substrate-binding protein
MEGKRFAFVDKATTAGYLLPLAYFKKYQFDYKTDLRESYYSGTHEDTIYDVLRKKADIGAAKNTVFERLAGTDERIRKELKILERSPEVPENGLAVRKDLDETLKRKIGEALLAMHDDEEGRAILKTFGARKFVKTEDSDYAPVYRYARQIGLKLASYNYTND